MKKSDGKLFNPEFVHFMWDDVLEGREGFFANDIDTLKDAVNYNSSDNRGVVKKGVERCPFKFAGGLCYVFFYYDPNCEYKKAWLEGKRVQYMTTIYVKNDWKDVPDEWYWDGDADTQYRIKPEETWRPCRDVDELKKVWADKAGLSADYEEPLIWIRSKSNPSCTRLINGYNDVDVAIGYDWITVVELFREWEFLDGSPIGVEE